MHHLCWLVHLIFAMWIAFAVYPSGVWNTFVDRPVFIKGSVSFLQCDVASESAILDGIVLLCTSLLNFCICCFDLVN